MTSGVSRPGDEHGSAVWRSLPLRLAIVAIPLWFTVAVLIFNVGWRIKLLIGVVLGVTLAAPAEGLLLAAALAPLGHLIAGLTGMAPFRMGEAIILAFLVGWVLRGAPNRRGPGVPAPLIGALFALTIIASIVGLAWHLKQLPDALAETADALSHSYYLIADRIGFIDGARLLEGLALVAATVTLFRQRPALSVTLPVVLAGSASVAAIASVLLWRGIAPAEILQRNTLGNYGISAHVADVNAAGSYFAMILCLALGMTVRAYPRRRVAWGAASIACGVGLWFTESRAALAAAGIIILVAMTWYVVVRMKPVVRTAAVGAVLVLALSVAAYRVQQVSFGADYRQQFSGTSLRMIEARPLFGVGIGQYYPMSALFLSPHLAWNDGVEHAHNSFLEIGAELGLVGLGLFVAWIGTGLVRAVRALARQPRDARLLGVTGGVAAFVGTWLGGHPLLVSEVAFPFWIQFGLMVGLAGSTLLNAAAELPVVDRRGVRAG